MTNNNIEKTNTTNAANNSITIDLGKISSKELFPAVDSCKEFNMDGLTINITYDSEVIKTSLETVLNIVGKDAVITLGKDILKYMAEKAALERVQKTAEMESMRKAADHAAYEAFLASK